MLVFAEQIYYYLNTYSSRSYSSSKSRSCRRPRIHIIRRWGDAAKFRNCRHHAQTCTESFPLPAQHHHRQQQQQHTSSLTFHPRGIWAAKSLAALAQVLDYISNPARLHATPNTHKESAAAAPGSRAWRSPGTWYAPTHRHA